MVTSWERENLGLMWEVFLRGSGVLTDIMVGQIMMNVKSYMLNSEYNMRNNLDNILPGG